VPVAAARQAEVGAADPQPVEAGRVGQHLLQQFAVAPLERLALAERGARLGDPPGERVADLLQLTQVEHPRRSHGGDPMRHLDPAQAFGDEAAELPLEPPDLPSQLGACEPLIDRDPVEQTPHSQSLSRLEGRCSNP
jgi:hypothetical protein